MFGHVNVSSSMTDFDMSDLMPPPDAKDAFETAHVKGLQSLYVHGDDMGSMSRNRIQEDRDANGFIDCDFGGCCKVVVQQYTVR